MESGNPLLDDYVLGLTGAERPRVCFLPSASGDADHYIVRFYRAFSAHRCEASHISLFRREQGPEDLRAPPALPGPDLRRRRQRRQPARRLARARHRRDPARSLGSRGHPLRPLGRLALLVRRGGDRLPRRAAAARRARPAAVQQLRPLRAAARSAASPTTASCARGCAPATPPRTAPPCTSSATELSRGRRLPARGPRLPARRRRAAGGRDADRDHLPRRTGAAPRHRYRRRSPPRSPPDGAARQRRRRRAGDRRCAGSSPSAATTSPRARPTARSASCCCGWPPSAAASGRGSASCRPPAATPPSRSAASTPPSASAPASPPTSRCSGSAGGRWRCATTCSPRT